MRQSLLVHLLTVNSIGKSVQHARPVVQGVDDAVGNREVVPSKIKLGLPTRGKVDPARIADLDDSIPDLQLDPLRRHGRNSRRALRN
jgi:hypothetical protein